MAERLELHGPWFRHPVTGKMVDYKDLPEDHNQHVLRFRSYQDEYMRREYRAAGERY